MKVIKAKSGISDWPQLAVIFAIDRRMPIEVGDKLDLSVVGFNTGIVLNEKVEKRFVLRDLDFDINRLILQGKTMRTCVDMDEAQRVARAISALASTKLMLDEFDIYLWGDGMPAIFVMRTSGKDNFPGNAYGFVMVPFIVDSDEYDPCNEVMNR